MTQDIRRDPRISEDTLGHFRLSYDVLGATKMVQAILGYQRIGALLERCLRVLNARSPTIDAILFLTSFFKRVVLKR